MNYLHDIFISYPSTLNKTPYADWVMKFEAKLRHAFEELSRKRPEPDIYLDRWKVEANSSHAEMLDRARGSRIFLAIVSPNYQERVWAPRELEAFAGDLQDLGRLFVIASKPLPEKEVRLEGLKGRPIKPFHEHNVDKRKALPFHPESLEFERGIYELAVVMAEKLDKMLVGDEHASAATQALEGKRRTILLAHVTDDLERAHRQVADELTQQCLEHDVVLLSGADYPLGGEAFKQAFAEDLARADLVVQLLGDTLGKRPRDLPEGYVLTQARVAASRPGVKLMQWRRSNIDPQLIDDPELRELLQGETVTASTLSAFREALIEWVRTPPPKPAAESDAPCGAQVFINAEKADLPAALACREAVSDLCASVWVPPQGDPEKASIQEEFNSLLADCDSLLFLNGDVEPVWVSKQMRQAVKTRASNRLSLRGAVCNGPPAGKPQIHGIVRGIEMLECSTPDGSGWSFEPVREFVKKLTDTPL
jgi:hypothetical protein